MSFWAHIESISADGFVEMFRKTEKEAERVRSGLGSQRNRQANVDYDRCLSNLLFWLRYGAIPMGASDEEVEIYQLVAKSLVAKGELKATALEAIESRLEGSRV
jgi:hypothetical protein